MAIRNNRALGLFGILGAAALGQAQIVVDGVRDAAYNSPTVVQGVPTGFGDSSNGAVGSANGSELDAAYYYAAGDSFRLFLAGNLESNFNKLEIFFDVDGAANGQNRLRGDNISFDNNTLDRMGDDGSGNGLTFDSDFFADYYFTGTMGGANPDVFANFATLPTGGNGTGGYIGTTTAGSDGTLTGGTNPFNIRFTVDNSNTGGVTGSGVGDPASVTTGMELLIPYAALGNPIAGTSIKITAFINSGDHSFVSNQFLGPVPTGTGNLGEVRNVNLTSLAGNQYFTAVVPEPGSMAALALGALGLLVRRRRAAKG